MTATKSPPAKLNHAPVSLPAVSVDFQKLRDGLDDATKAKPADRADAVTDAIKGANLVDGALDSPDLSVRADQKIVEREHPELGITEQVRVHDPESDAAATMADEADAAEHRLTSQAENRAALVSEPDLEVIDTPAPVAPARND